MPDEPTWLHRVPEILQRLTASSAPPFLDRSALEVLFGLRRRQAIRLLHQCGGYQVGRTFLVNRADLIEYLKAWEEKGSVASASHRKQRVLDALADAREILAGRRIVIPARRRDFAPHTGDLPSGVSLEPGRLTVTYNEPLELVEKLFELSQAIMNDFGRFEKLARR